MATLGITVFDGAGEVALGDPIQEIAVAISGTSAQSAAITGNNRIRRRVRLFSDTDCFVTWSENPTATNDFTSGRAIAAEVVEYFDIQSGYLVAVIERA